MSSPSSIARRALMRDALAQVLDNKVFRILMVLTFLMVALTFVIGFREDEVNLLWGFKSYDYADLPGMFMIDVGAEQQRQAIDSVQGFFVSGLAGTFGLLFCIAATSFFVPRMLEKGAADPLFSKPVSRFALLVSRYIASVLFIAILASLLVGGIHIGLLVNSGYSSEGFLWSAPRLVYQFALIAAVSALVGVWTRSNTAALLLTFVFYAVCTGVHNGWIVKEFTIQQPDFGMLKEIGSAGADEQVVEEIDGFAHYAGMALNTAHYVLPKTHDAPRIERLLRDQLDKVLDGGNSAVAAHVNGRPLIVERLGDSGLSVRYSSDEYPAFGEERGPWTLNLRREKVLVEVLEDGTLGLFQDGEALELIDPGSVFEQTFDPFEWYDARFGWGTPWKSNAWFSLLTSLAFVAATLGIAWLKLRRISF